MMKEIIKLLSVIENALENPFISEEMENKLKMKQIEWGSKLNIFT